MCIAILNKVGTLPKEYIQNSWDNNYHGAGFAYSDGNKIIVYKTDTNADVFYKKYKKARKSHPDVPFLLHFRISTHGTITTDNLHPFLIGDNVALIHNGMIDLDGHSKNDNRSDTRFFCEEILAKLPYGWQHSVGIHTMIEQLGGWSKFVLLDVDHNSYIIGEDAGHWYDGNWYSNNSYKQVNKYVDFGGKKVEKGGSTTGGFLGYGNSGWDDDYDYPVSSKSYSNTVSVPVATVTKVEAVLRDKQVIGRHDMLYSTYIESDAADNGQLIDDYYGESSDMKLDTWYHMAEYDGPKESRWDLMITNVDDKVYTVIGQPNKVSTYGSYYIIPFAIRHDDIVANLLDMLNYEKVYNTTSARVMTAIDNCYYLLDEMYYDTYGGYDNVQKEQDVEQCDACLVAFPKDDMSKVFNQYKVCKDCATQHEGLFV